MRRQVAVPATPRQSYTLAKGDARRLFQKLFARRTAAHIRDSVILEVACVALNCREKRFASTVHFGANLVILL